MAGIDGIGSIQDNYEKYKDMFTNKDNDLITMESFYQLLVAEMQNQDPLEPTSNTEFISQMASFTSLQAQQDNFQTQQQNYANSLVGKTVTVQTMSGELITGTVNYTTVGETPQVNVNGSNYNLSAIRQLHTGSESVSGGISDYGAFATGLLGKNVMVQATDVDGTTFLDEGTVSSLEIQDGEIRLVINGYAYKPSDVVRITEAVNQVEVPQGEEIDEEETVQQTGVAENLKADEVKTDATEETAKAEETAKTNDTAEESRSDVVYTGEEDIPDIEDNELYELFN